VTGDRVPAPVGRVAGLTCYPVKSTSRCVMVDLPQRDLARNGRILRTLADTHDLTFGLQAQVVRGGSVRRGDAVVLR
jgi:uncharacterized protein YcbX